MGLGHLCGSGGIRGKTVEYPTEYGVTAGDLCTLVPENAASGDISTSEKVYNSAMFERSDGKKVYFYSFSQVGAAYLCAKVEGYTEVSLLSNYTVQGGYVVKPNIIHLYCYHREDSTPNGLYVFEIDISTDTPAITKTVFSIPEDPTTVGHMNFGDSGEGYACVYKIDINKYIYATTSAYQTTAKYKFTNKNAVFAIYDNGETFSVSNILVYDRNVFYVGAPYNKQNFLLYNTTSKKFTKYTYTLTNNKPELTETALTVQNISVTSTGLISGTGANFNDLITFNNNHFMLVNVMRTGTQLAHFILNGNTITQQGATLQVSNTLISVNGVFGDVFVQYGGITANITNSQRNVVSISDELKLVKIEQIPPLIRGSFQTRIWVYKRTNTKMLAYGAAGDNSTWPLAVVRSYSIKPIPTLEHSSEAFYAMGSVAPDNYGKFRNQPKEG